MSGLVPKYIDQVNSVVRWWENPCDAPWTLYFELALPALGRAIVQLLMFDVDDVVRGYARPKGIRTGRHGRKGRKSGRRRGGIPEIGELIGKNWPGHEELHGRSVTNGVRNLWLIDGVIQRVLYWWLIADVTLGFFAEWLTAVQESEVCRTQRVGAAAFEAAFTVGAIQGWIGFSVTKLYATGSVQVSGSEVLHTGGFVWTGGDCTVVAGFQGESIPPGDPGVQLQVRIRKGEEIVDEETTNTLPDDPLQQGVVLRPRRVRGAGEAIIEVRCVPTGFFRVTQGIGVGVQTIQDLS